MKKSLLLTAMCIATQFLHAQINDPGTVAQQGATTHVNNDMSSGVNNGLNRTESAIKGLFKKKNKAPKADSANQASASPGTSPGGQTGVAGTTGNPTAAATGNPSKPGNATGCAAGSGPATGTAGFKMYSNYDFVPGEKIIFEDDFADDQDGEFPSHWTLQSGQGILNKVDSNLAFFLTEGNYVRVGPRMKTADNYLPEDFTIEFDFYSLPDKTNTTGLLFYKAPGSGGGQIFFGENVSTSYFTRDFSVSYPGDKDHFTGKWHHAAMIKKGSQIKCYEDQYRVLVMPDCGDCKLTSLDVGGIGGVDDPIVFKNFRIAAGGNMNMIGKKFTDAKIITHGINFDIDKATLKPESMGTLNMIVNILKGNPDIKFEIDGHTDNSGNAPHNLALSQQRADAVRGQLVTMGVDPTRLTTKGFGDTKPIADNSSPEGKANNRRVEFVKI